ncbi:MAG: radical SAM protein, partial [Nanobdellota archaeon]
MDPPRADIRLGYLCNHNCKFCCVSDNRKFNLATGEVKNDIDKAKESGAEKIVFTGGEPTIRNDILDLVKYSKKMGFTDILIITNGQMTSYPEFFKNLVDAGLTSICFSIPDIRKKRYEYLTQTEGSFDKLKKSIENAFEYDILVSTITVITKINYQYLPEIAEFLSKLSKRFSSFFSEFMFINPTNNAWRYRKELVPQICNVAPFVRKSLKISEKTGLVLNVEAIPICYMNGYERNVVELHMAKERVFLDPESEPDFEYNKNRKEKGKVQSEECSNCKWKNVCEGVWRNYAKIYGLSELKEKASEVIKNKLLSVTIACNQECIFCTHDKFLKTELPDLEKKPVINSSSNEYGNKLSLIKKEIFDSKCEELTIVGGEPTTRKDLAEIIRYAAACGCRDIIMNSNGVNLHDMDYLKKLKRAGLTKTLVSLHSHLKEKSENISQKDGNFAKTVQGIKNSLALGLGTNIVHVIYEGNYRELKDFVGFVAKEFKGIECLNFVFIKPNSKNKEENRKLVPRLTDVKGYLNEAMDECSKKGIKFNVANFPICLMYDYKDYNTQKNEIESSGASFETWLNKRIMNNEMDEYG